MKPLKRIILIVALLPAAPLFAQFDFPILFGAGPAMGGMSLALSDEGSSFSSIAGLAHLDGAVASATFRQNFSTGGLGYASAAAAVPTDAGCWAASFVHYGNSDYGEQCLSLAYALLPSKGPLSAGVAFHYLHSGTSDPYYSPQNLFTFSAAIRCYISDRMILAFKAYNPIAVKLSNGEHTPALLTLGVSYLLLDELLAAAELEKKLHGNTSLRMGLQYLFHDNYHIRTGFSTQPVIYTFGLGIRWNHFVVDLAAQVHSVLGLTPSIALLYRF